MEGFVVQRTVRTSPTQDFLTLHRMAWNWWSIPGCLFTEKAMTPLYSFLTSDSNDSYLAG